MPRDSCHFNLIWILIQLFVKFLVGGSLFLLGGVVGALLQVYWGTSRPNLPTLEEKVPKTELLAVLSDVY